MSEKRNINLFLTDILTACEKILRYADSIHQENGICDEKEMEAILYNLLVLGEAARSVPSEYKSLHPEVPWKRMVGMHDKLIHQYWGMQQMTIWNTIEHNIPDLMEKMRNLIIKESDQSDETKP